MGQQPPTAPISTTFGRSPAFAAHRYTCAKGHSFTISGCWTTLEVIFNGRPPRSFNYCMECFGEWAESQWPLKCEAVIAPGTDERSPVVTIRD